ncbi:hypothetical protein ABW21_db0206927 [Orbilia brochopaga]|nr:hypothetical protein ABW21_db0206927 [Drechslerella brochopaga]
MHSLPVPSLLLKAAAMIISIGILDASCALLRTRFGERLGPAGNRAGGANQRRGVHKLRGWSFRTSPWARRCREGTKESIFVESRTPANSLQMDTNQRRSTGAGSDVNGASAFPCR